MKKLFEDLKKQNRAVLAIFVSCGDPSLAFTEKLVERICGSGADIVELGVPFSDPVADGKIIQAAGGRAIKGGCTLDGVFKMVASLRAKGVDKKFVLFSYYNPIFKYGVDSAAEASAKAGIDAWLVVDVPLEECAEIKPALDSRGIDLVPLAAPTTPLERVREMSEKGSGFLYYISVVGITGARESLPSGLAERIDAVRANSRLPVAVGFGISNGKMAAEVAKSADAVVVGSRFVDIAHKTLAESGEAAALDAASAFVAELAQSVGR